MQLVLDALVLIAHFALTALAWTVLWPAVVVGHLMWRGGEGPYDAWAHTLMNLPGDAVHYVEHYLL